MKPAGWLWMTFRERGGAFDEGWATLRRAPHPDPTCRVVDVQLGPAGPGIGGRQSVSEEGALENHPHRDVRRGGRNGGVAALRRGCGSVRWSPR